MKGFFTGILAGLAIGYLTAPRSGKDTRDKLVEAANDQTKGIKDFWDNTIAQAVDTFDNVLSQVGLAADKVDDKYDDLKGEVTSTYRQAHLKGAYNKNVDKLADAAKSGVNKAEDGLTTN